ncbi:helix-turn-helix transcriptional regulator [Rhodoferax sp. BLA1]|uniref:helix-turn-helix domain-containing protein n=1 Tax=Rhodoferax sp. BLA1 TaxID=2576062 RepID=UPI002108301D|nr:helix-turn-helix transcriptional regulator [Rhodoferax sp. BLA1]
MTPNTEFENTALRLKLALSVYDDKDLASMLGLSQAAFFDRKKRGSFPVKELWALKGKRPDLNLNVDHILGKATPNQSVIPAPADLIDPHGFGERLKVERSRLGLRPEELAELCGVGKSSQFRYETGEASPNADYLCKARAAGVRLEFLFAETN